jgi:hypothetical protein
MTGVINLSGRRVALDLYCLKLRPAQTAKMATTAIGLLGRPLVATAARGGKA